MEARGDADRGAKISRESNDAANPLAKRSLLEQNVTVVEPEASGEEMIQSNSQSDNGEAAPDDVALNGNATVDKGDLISGSLDKLAASLSGNGSQGPICVKHDPGLGEALRLSAVDDENLPKNLASDDSLSMSSSSLDPSDLSEDTTSSDSNLSSEDSEDESGPEEASSRREGPERVVAPPRQENRPVKKLCRQFAKTGHCSRGHRCRFLHELPRQNGQAKASELMQGPERRRERRLGLFRAVGASHSLAPSF
jgi:hypothetical protein